MTMTDADRKGLQDRLKVELAKEPNLKIIVDRKRDEATARQSELTTAQFDLNLCRANIEVLRQLLA